jgi:replicative DNA helicase
MMKVIAKERNIAIVVCAQLNRDFKGREDPRPQLSDLAESGGIEQFGCNILLLHYPDKTVPGVYDPDLYEVIAAKSRYGSTGIVSFDFDGGTVQIRERGKVAEEASAQEELFVNGSK